MINGEMCWFYFIGIGRIDNESPSVMKYGITSDLRKRFNEHYRGSAHYYHRALIRLSPSLAKEQDMYYRCAAASSFEIFDAWLLTSRDDALALEHRMRSWLRRLCLSPLMGYETYALRASHEILLYAAVGDVLDERRGCLVGRLSKKQKLRRRVQCSPEECVDREYADSATLLTTTYP